MGANTAMREGLRTDSEPEGKQQVKTSQCWTILCTVKELGKTENRKREKKFIRITLPQHSTDTA